MLLVARSLRRVVIAVLLLLLAGSARAAPDMDGYGGWLWMEYRQGLYTRGAPRLSLRVQSDTRTSSRSDVGLTQQFLRVGFLLEPTRWLSNSVNAVALGNREDDGHFSLETRLEEELFFTPRIGPIQIIDRNRLEFRWRAEADALIRYRNMLRIQYAPPWLRFRPFVWNEWFIDSRALYNENWTGAGVNFVIKPNVTLDVGYQLRLREQQDVWIRDHNLLLNLLVTVPAPRRR